MERVRHSGGAKAVIAVLSLLVLIVQLCSPSGFMPMRTASGFVIALCSGQGPMGLAPVAPAQPARVGAMAGGHDAMAMMHHVMSDHAIGHHTAPRHDMAAMGHGGERHGGDGHHGNDDGMTGRSTCGFAASVQPAVPPLVLADVPLPSWQIAYGVIAFALKTGVIARLAAPPPPSSGPPAAFHII